MANTAVVYDREIGSRTLNFEASGALMNASLVMRDRETDSWWSIMTSTAIGGALDGAELDELPFGEKATWKEWKKRHPDTRVLSVDGVEHRPDNPYESYFASDATFRDMEISDRRLPPKTPVFSFWLDGRTFAVPHRSAEGGRLFAVPGDAERAVLLHRDPGAPIFASTRAWVIPAAATASSSAADLVNAAEAGDLASEPVDGFDTFWYSWVSVNPDSQLLR